jgi:hypothetical protein
MRRIFVLTFMLVCGLLASVSTASAGECRVLVGGNQKDVFNNTVWSSTGVFYHVGYYGDANTCLSEARPVVNSVARSVCLNHLSAVNITMLGDVYFDGTPVNGWWAPSSCRSGFGLNYYTTLAPGQSLYPGDSLWSVNSDYELKYQTDANLVFYQGSTALWAINCMPTCNNLGNAGVATMQTDGNFVAYDDTNNAVWDSSTYGAYGAFLAIRYGQLLIFSPSGSVLWSKP